MEITLNKIKVREVIAGYQDSADATPKSPQWNCTCKDASIDERVWCPVHDA
jgi:hypothetical protein